MDWNEYKQRLRALIERECGASLMNDTKWMEAVGLIRELGLSCRIKLLTRPEPTDWGRVWSPRSPSYIEASHMGPVLALEVE